MAKSKEREGYPGRRRVHFTFRFAQFELPPVHSALIIGKRAPVGAIGTARAFQEMAPGMFRLVAVDHPIIEGVLLRECDLRKVAEADLVARLVRQAEKMMGETDILHVILTLEVTVEEEGTES
jgi:hypothetical protein